MLSVFINQRRKEGKKKIKKKERKQLKVPKSPWLFYYPHPTEKESTRKEAEEEEKPRVEQVGWGNFPCEECSGGGREYEVDGNRKEWEGGNK